MWATGTLAAQESGNIMGNRFVHFMSAERGLPFNTLALVTNLHLHTGAPYHRSSGLRMRVAVTAQTHKEIFG